MSTLTMNPGKVSDREQFQRMFEDASWRQFDVLLFWSLDRLSREGVLPTLQHLQRLTGYGVGYRFTEQSLLGLPPVLLSVSAAVPSLCTESRSFTGDASLAIHLEATI